MDNEPQGLNFIKDVARRMHRIMNTLKAYKGTVVLTEEAYGTMDDKDFTVMWYMPVSIVTTEAVQKDIERRARTLGLLNPRKFYRSDKISSN
jgi:hypothetical protein